jgi:hypothetical protein
MKKSILLTLFIAIISMSINAQETALTTNGEKVYLYNNGTWKYANKSQNNFEQYTGRWKTTKVKKNRLSEFQIKKEGNNYIFQALDHDFFLGSDYKAVLKNKNGNLILTGVPLSGDVDLILIEGGKSLLFKGTTYTKN